MKVELDKQERYWLAARIREAEKELQGSPAERAMAVAFYNRLHEKLMGD